MNNLQILLDSYRLVHSLTPLKSELDIYRKNALDSLKELILELVSDDSFIEFCGKLSEKE